MDMKPQKPVLCVRFGFVLGGSLQGEGDRRGQTI